MSFTPDKTFARQNFYQKLSTQAVPQNDVSSTRTRADFTDYLYGNEPRLIISFRVSVSKIENNPSLGVSSGSSNRAES